MSVLLESLKKVREYLQNAPLHELKEQWEAVKDLNSVGPKYSEIVAFDELDWQEQMRLDTSGTVFSFGKHSDGIISTAATNNGLLSIERSFCF